MNNLPLDPKSYAYEQLTNDAKAMELLRSLFPDLKFNVGIIFQTIEGINNVLKTGHPGEVIVHINRNKEQFNIEIHATSPTLKIEEENDQTL